MRRRQLLTLAGAALLAGCTDDETGGGNGGSNQDGRTVVNERVFSESTFRFDASAGETITVTLTNDQGYIASGILYPPQGDVLIELQAETEQTKRAEAPEDETYVLAVTPDQRASVKATVN